jgi:DNA modification methylase
VNTKLDTEVFPLSELEAATYNPREITPQAMTGLSESLTRLGLLDLPVVNVRNGKKTIVGGHQRVAVLKKEGYTHVRCVVVRFDDVAERAANLTLNNPAVRGTWDPLKAHPLLASILPSLGAPTVMGFDVLDADIARQLKLLEAGRTPAGAPGAAPDKPKSKVGQVYHLGDHRLVCGPFEKHLAALLGKKEAVACITDPPYNVAYESASGESIQGDAQTPEQWLTFLDTLAQVVLAATSGPCFMFMASRELPALDAAWRKNRGRTLRWLFWAKSSFTLGRGDYHHAHEPILYGSRGTVTVPAFAHDVLEYPKPSVNELHPTQKPVELIQELMQASTQPGDLVIDPFVGSGTTLAVAQATGRVCYASELDPRFCDVTRKRWAEQVHGIGCDWVKVTSA